MATQAARGKRLLEEKDYAGAIAQYTLAIKDSPSSPDFYIQRSTAYQRAGKNEEALADAEQAVLNAQKRAKKEAIIEGQFRRGIALHRLGRNADAEFILKRVKEMKSDHKAADMWINMSKNALKDIGADDERRKVTVTETPAPREGGAGMPSTEAPAAPTAKPSVQLPAAAAPSQTPADKIRYEWYQNTENIYFTLLAKGVPKDKIQVDITARSMNVSFPLQTGSLYDLTIDPLFAPVLSDKSITRVMPSKVEIILIKKTPGQKWSALESSETPIEPPKTDSAMSSDASNTDDVVKRAIFNEAKATGPAYPTSSKSGPKNWDKLLDEGDDKDDEDGDPANAFFKKLYKGADPDTQRAMMKSYVESNGTALSTNWSEVGKAPVKTEPPDGMEAKQWSK